MFRRQTIFKYAILTISDAGSKGERADTSGDTIEEMMDGATFELGLRGIVPDERDQIAQRLSDWCDSEGLDLVLTTGGTGLGPRDVTPEATRQVLDVEAPGIAEAMRAQTLANTPLAMLSRSTAGVRSGCLIVNLPGSPKAVRECLDVALPALPHALEMVKGWRTH
jgi:molybdopterin adenylyltransferase